MCLQRRQRKSSQSGRRIGTDITDSEEEVVNYAERRCELARHLFALTLHLLVVSTGLERCWNGAWLICWCSVMLAPLPPP